MNNLPPSRPSMVHLAARVVLSVGIASALMAGCSEDADTPPVAVTPSDTGGGGGVVGTATIAGTVIAGPVSGATVTAYLVKADGLSDKSVGVTTTGPDGSFKLNLSELPADGKLLIVAKGGTYVSEFDGATITLESELRAYLSGITSEGASGVIVTPLSDLVAARAKTLVAGGAALDAALTIAEALVKKTYGIASALSKLAPTFDKESIGKDGYLLGLILGAFDSCGKSLSPAARGALIAALSEDFSDGLYDGKVNGLPVALKGSDVALGSTAGTSDFLSCVASYSSTGKSVTDAGITPSELTGTVADLRASIVSSPVTPTSTGLSASSSGAISSLAYGGKQWVFIAARSQGVVAIDVTDPAATAPTVKVFKGLVAANFKGQEIGGVVPLLGADHPQLLVFAYASKHVALVNADTGVVEFETDLALTNGPYGFSGGSAYISGAIPDTGRDGVWLSTVDGYIFFDRATKTLSTKPSQNFGFEGAAVIAENLGGDVSHGYLFSPNYKPGVQLADLTAGKSYFLFGAPFQTLFPNFYEPDAGSVDTKFQVGVLTEEDSPDVGFINLATIIKSDSITAGTPSTFLPAATNGSVAIKLGSSGPIISGSAVDSDSHLALFMAGYSSDIAVGLIQDPATVAPGAQWQGLSDWRYVRNLPGYSFARDPHAVAVIKNLSNGKVYGYLLDGGAHKSLVVDMAALLAAPPLGTTGDAAHTTAMDLAGTGTVKAIAW